MREISLEAYVGQDSPLHRFDPRVKTVCFISLVLVVVLTPPTRFAAFFLYFFLLLTLVFMAGLPLSAVAKRSLVVLPFAGMIGLFNLFYKPPIIFFNILVKSWLSVLALILLSSTTDFPSLLKAFESLKTPRLFTTVLSFMYRYLSTLIDQVEKLERARQARSYGRRGLYQMKAFGNMLGSLFINTYERGERIYQAMLARGYHGHAHTTRRFAPGIADAAFAVFFFASLGAIVTEAVL